MEQRENSVGDIVKGQEGTADGVARWLRGFGGEEATARVLSMCMTMAARVKNVDLVKQLLEQGAKPEMAAHPDHPQDPAAIVSYDGEDDWTTPWSAAVSVDSAECLEAMINAGMNPVKPRLFVDELVDQEAFLAVEAARLGAERCLAVAMDWAQKKAGPKLAIITKESWAALNSRHGSADKVEAMARILIGAGGNIDEECFEWSGSKTPMTPLGSAACGDLEMLMGLLAAGADPRVGFALNFAAGSWHEKSAQCVSHLLRAGCDPNLKRDGAAPLLGAIEINNTDKARMLIDAGANLDAVSAEGFSLLAVAAIRGASRCVSLLLDEGFDPDERTEGMSLAELTSKFRREHCLPETRDMAEAMGIIKAASEAKTLAVASGEAQKKMAARRI